MVKTRCQIINNRLTDVDGHAPAERIDKHLKMARDPFLFYRGSSQLFYADIKQGVLKLPNAFNEVSHTYVTGDCHISNFGFFTEEGSHGDNVIFAPNDFDDACVGPAIWDISRFAISLLLAADYGQRVVAGELDSDEKYIGKLATTNDQAQQAITAFIDAYIACCLQSVSFYSKNSSELLQSAIETIEVEHVLHKSYQKALRRSANGNEFIEKSSLAKAVAWTESTIQFKDNADRFERVTSHTYQEIEHAFAPYVDDSILDIVTRIGAGTGSLNLSRYYLLVGPKDFSGTNDLPLCHIVEVKQQRKAAPLYHFNETSAINRLNPAHLTIQCQRQMQRNPDLVLDEVVWQDAFWLVRSRHHAKVGIDPERVVIGKKAVQKNGFAQYAQLCGKALALAHCRGDRRSGRFEQSIADVLSNNKAALVNTCNEYHQQVKLDTEHLRKLTSV